MFLSQIVVPLDYPVSHLFQLGWYEHCAWLWIIQTLLVAYANPWTSTANLCWLGLYIWLTFFSFFFLLALYQWFSTCRYSWACVSWYSSLVSQRYIQGSSCHMGPEVSWALPWKKTCSKNFRQHWQMVHAKFIDIQQLTPFQNHNCCPILWNSTISTRVGIQAMDWRWF